MHSSIILVYSQTCATITTVNFGRFSSPQEGTSDQLAVTPHFSPIPSFRLIFLSLYIFLFQTFHINGIIQDVVFCDCLLSLSTFSKFIRLRYIPVELLDRIVTLCFTFQETVKLFSQATILYPHQQFLKSPISPHPCQHSIFLIITILVGVKWHFITVLICTSLMTNDVKHLFMSLLVMVYVLLEKMSTQILCPFFLKTFLIWTIFKVFIEFVTILLLFYVLVFWR